MAVMIDYSLEGSEFELQSCYSIRFQTNTFRKNMNNFIPSSIGEIVLLVFFIRGGFSIKWSKKVDMPLNKETDLTSMNSHCFKFYKQLFIY